MFRKTLFAAVLATAAAGPALAQMPPMDMGWAIQSQMRNQAVGDAAARNAAMAYYNYMLRLRASGYTGPSLPTGVTTQSLQNSIAGANAATQRYIAGSQVNSARTSNAIGDYNMRAVRGCYYGRDRWDNYGYVCP